MHNELKQNERILQYVNRTTTSALVAIFNSFFHFFVYCYLLVQILIFIFLIVEVTLICKVKHFFYFVAKYSEMQKQKKFLTFLIYATVPMKNN